MPIYEYECKNSHKFELRRSISDPPLKRCPECKAEVQKLISRSSFSLKGKWFKNTGSY